MKKIFILQGNPDPETLCCNFADVYQEEATKAGHEVRRMNLIDMKFDPLLHKGYKVIQALEPDLAAFQENLQWADHFVIVYPIWWHGMPSLLKALFERAWLPRFAFHFWLNGWGWDKLLKEKTARIITLSRTRPWLLYFMFGNYTNDLASAILGFAGFKVRQTHIGQTEKIFPERVERWNKRIKNLAIAGK